jgi:hypothetical protein
MIAGNVVEDSKEKEGASLNKFSVLQTGMNASNDVPKVNLGRSRLRGSQKWSRLSFLSKIDVLSEATRKIYLVK